MNPQVQPQVQQQPQYPVMNTANQMNANPNAGMGVGMTPTANANVNMNMNMGMGMGMNMNMGMGGEQPHYFTFQPNWNASSGVTHLNVTTVGQKTEQRNIAFQVLTMCLGMCFIFPLFFTCCMWWKKAVYPKW